MLDKEEIKQIREFLENSRNPVFFFDNDLDGLASFLLLSRYIQRGKGVAIKSFPDLNESYSRKLHEFNPDCVFILDKPIVSSDFLEEAKKLNIPVVWIDHHDVEVDLFNFDSVYYFNPIKKARGNEPVTFLCWQISQKKEDIWIALAGCIGDNFLPDFVSEFQKDFSDLWKEDMKTAFQVLYESDIGKIIRILNFALKDRTSNVVRMLKLLLVLKNPRDILVEDKKNFLLYRFNQVERKYKKLIEKAINLASTKLVFFQYGGDLSLSADISNELLYRLPGKIIVVAYVYGAMVNISLRGKKVRELTLKAIEGLEDATGGGHEDATGCKINVEDLPKFKERIENLIR